MAKLSQYKIDLKNLPDKTITYSFELDRKFFDAIDHEMVRKGHVQAEVALRETVGAYEFKFHLFGTIQIPCDRCLDEMDQEIDTHNLLIVKLGQAYEEVSDEIVIIPEDEAAINIAWYLYEFIVLNIPMKHVHEPGKCNKLMTSKYRKHQAVKISDGDEEEDDDDDGVDDSLSDESDMGSNESGTDIASEKNTDPRWDELKKLK